MGYKKGQLHLKLLQVLVCGNGKKRKWRLNSLEGHSKCGY